MANSCYGATGNSGFHYYDIKLAEAVTLTGQYVIKALGKATSDKINDILKTQGIDYNEYSDTDSIYLNLTGIVDTFCQGKTKDEIVIFLDKFSEKIMQPVISKTLDDIAIECNCAERSMSMKREAIASKSLFLCMKKYAMYVHNSEGVSYNPPKIKVMGIEIVRSSTPKWCRNKLKDSLKMIFESDEQSFRNKFNEIEKEFRTLSADEIAFPRGVSEIDKWQHGDIIKKGAPIHVRAAITYNLCTKKYKTYMPITNGARTKFIYLTVPNPVGQNVIGFLSEDKLPADLKLEKYIDYDTQFYKTFEKPLSALTEAAGWTVRELSTLDSFYG